MADDFVRTIERLICDSNGENQELIEITNDLVTNPSNFDLCKDIISNYQISPKLKLFLARCLIDIIEIRLDFFEASEVSNFLEWCLNFLFSNGKNEENTFICQIAHAFSVIVLNYWIKYENEVVTSFNQITKFFESDDRSVFIGLVLLKETIFSFSAAQSLYLKEQNDFGMKMLQVCFNYSYDWIVLKADKAEICEIALEVMELAISYKTAGNSEIEKSIPLLPSMQEVLSDISKIDFLFKKYQTTGNSVSLLCIMDICSITKSKIPYLVFNSILNRVSQLLIDLLTNQLFDKPLDLLYSSHILCLVAQKQDVYEFNDSEIYIPLFSKVAEFMSLMFHSNSNYFQENIESYIGFMKFWTILINQFEKSSDNEVVSEAKSLSIKVTLEYTQFLIDLVSSNDEETLFLVLGDKESELIKFYKDLINVVSEKKEGSVAEAIIQLFDEMRDSPLHLALFMKISSPIISAEAKSPHDSIYSYQIPFVERVFSVINESVHLIQSNQQNPILEQSIIDFFQIVNDNVLQRFPERFGEKEKLSNFFFDRIILTLKSFVFSDLISNALDSLKQKRLIPSNEALNELIEHHTPDVFPFMNIIENRRNRIMFITIITKYVFSFIIPGILLNYLNKFDLSATSDILSHVLDITGIFKAIEKNAEFMNLFQWVFIERSPSIIKEMPNMPIELYKPLLNMVISFFPKLSNQKMIIEFSELSPNSVIFFKTVSQFIEKPVDFVLSSTEEIRFQIVGKVFRIIANLLSISSIPYDVFELYHDNVMSNLFQSLHNILETLDPVVIF